MMELVFGDCSTDSFLLEAWQMTKQHGPDGSGDRRPSWWTYVDGSVGVESRVERQTRFAKDSTLDAYLSPAYTKELHSTCLL
jgi:hypothetical protein